MCGIIAILLGDREEPCNQLLFDGLTVLQHRGQDAAGIVTSDGERLCLRKATGLVSDVFKQHHMAELGGFMGIGHNRYPTAGNSSSAEAQPFYTNTPYGLCLAHNGNLTNCEELKQQLHDSLRHVNTTSDSELLLNVLADELMSTASAKTAISPENIFQAVRNLHKRASGGYAAVAMVTGGGIIAFRDPFGIRPLVFGTRATTGAAGRADFVVTSESVVIDALAFEIVRDVQPGEAIYIDCDGKVHNQMCHDSPSMSPCIFEHVYMARPDSVIDGVSVYAARLRMGEKLAAKIKRVLGDDIGGYSVVMPIPDTSRPSALQCAVALNLPYREGFIKNRYIARTFIMPGQKLRQKTIKQKLNPIKSEFMGKRVILVDDSIVRGTTSTQIVQLARDVGAASVCFVSASPAIIYPNVYGIDMPVVSELIAHGRDEKGVAEAIGADCVVYNDLADLEDSVREVCPELCTMPKNRQFDTSCFSGKYVTGDIDAAYFKKLEKGRSDAALAQKNKKYVTVVGAAGDGTDLDVGDGALMNTPV